MDGFKKLKIPKIKNETPPPTPVPTTVKETVPVSTATDRNPFKKFGEWFGCLSKIKKTLFCLIILIVVAGVTVGIVLATRPAKKVVVPPIVKEVEPIKEVPKPTTEASRLTGVQITPELNKRGVTGIMIENSPDARPQSGLKDAGVVFEAIAEGGITRFLTLFQESQPDYIGPVRSVRPYYLDWLQGFDAPIAHAGGSGDGLAKLKNDHVEDLDQFANGGAYMRVNSRYAPHNLYTTMAKLDDLKSKKGWSESTFEGFARKDEKALATPTAKTIDFTISSFLYSPHYEYDATNNSYKRSEGGKPHTDEKSGVQLSPKVIIADVMNYSIIDSDHHSGYNTIGNGKAFVFQDGGVTVGTWEKTSSKSQIVWKDSAGAVIKLNPGQTWISAVNSNGAVKYTP